MDVDQGRLYLEGLHCPTNVTLGKYTKHALCTKYGRVCLTGVFMFLRFDHLLRSFHHHIRNIKEKTSNRFGFIIKLHIIIINLIQLNNL